MFPAIFFFFFFQLFLLENTAVHQWPFFIHCMSSRYFKHTALSELRLHLAPGPLYEYSHFISSAAKLAGRLWCSCAFSHSFFLSHWLEERNTEKKKKQIARNQWFALQVPAEPPRRFGFYFLSFWTGWIFMSPWQQQQTVHCSEIFVFVVEY